MGSGLDQGLIHVGAAVAEELPGFADFGNHIEVEVGGEDFVFVARRLGEDAAAGIAEIARAVEFADIPRGFGAHAVDGADEIAVGDGVGGLLQLPQILAETGDGGRGVEDDLGAGQSQSARAFGEVAVVADVDADFDEAEVEDGEAEVAGAEVELLPEAGRDVRDVALAVLAEEAAVVVDDGGGVVVDACLLDFVDGHDEGNVILLRQILHEADGGSVGDGLGEIVPAGGLLGAEVGPVEDLLEADDLRAGPGGLLDISDVLIDHGLLGGGKRGVRRGGVSGLNQRTANDARHENSLDYQLCGLAAVEKCDGVYYERSVTGAQARGCGRQPVIVENPLNDQAPRVVSRCDRTCQQDYADFSLCGDRHCRYRAGGTVWSDGG